MKIFGHPVHIMLIHFPAALFPMDLACSIISYCTGNLSFAQSSFYAMAGGVLLGILAIITGAVDLIGVSAKRAELVNKVLLHGVINSVVVTGYAILAFIAYKNFVTPTVVPLSIIIIKVFLNGGMIAGNYFGGNLVLKHKIGIES